MSTNDEPNLLPAKVEAEALPPEIPAEEARQPVSPTTAAQAKVDAVANLTFEAYRKASTLALTKEEIAMLQEDFPDDAFQPGAGGNAHLIYIEHAHLRDRLNRVIGPGQWAIIPRNRWVEPFVTARATEGSRVYVEAMLVIRGAFVAEAVGSMDYFPKNEATNYGDAVEGAKTAALRRCCKELGIGLQAWKKDWCEGWWQRRRANRRGFAESDPNQSPPAVASSPPAPKTKEPSDWDIWLANCKAKFIAGIQGNPTVESAALKHFRDLGLLLPTESLADLPPAQLFPIDPSKGFAFNKAEVKKVFDLHMQKIQAMVNGGDKPIAVPRDPEAKWKSWPLPKWSKHAKQYRTFGSLPKNLLWWWCCQWEPKGYTDKQGSLHAPSREDLELRKMLDFVKGEYDFDQPSDSDGDPAEYGDS